jgi:hypothetical protein
MKRMARGKFIGARDPAGHHIVLHGKLPAL